MANRNTTTQTHVAQPAVTFAPEALQQVIAQAVREALASKEKSDRSIDPEALTIRAFKRAGFGEVKPRQDVKTYNLWLADGLRVKEGERSVKVRNLRLFHKSQVRPMTVEEKAQGSASKLPPVSPISEPANAAVKATAKAAKAVPVEGSGSLQ
ncbi:MAG TPA: hypothetical protein VNY08_08185 [Bradyrhizobium sp.]|jgi:hypothetical protein|nr:hypothetical protein [Bradyrhizobium sp.]